MERDRDALMRRTRARPLPTGEVAPADALVFGIVLNAVAFVVLAVFTNLLAASLTIVATLFYVFVYTWWLKPRTPQNIVIGGAAGAMPTLIGWAAVRGSVGLTAWCLFAIVFLWTPAHFWALATHYRDDYAAADIPMLPVVRGAHATARQIVVYACLTVAATLVVPFVGTASWLYTAVAVAAGGLFMLRAFGLARHPTAARAIRFFVWSNVYLMLVFAALAFDQLLL
jgi:protoheme IX farnesyltransferase